MFKKMKKLIQRLITPSNGKTYLVTYFSRDKVFFSQAVKSYFLSVKKRDIT